MSKKHFKTALGYVLAEKEPEFPVYTREQLEDMAKDRTTEELYTYVEALMEDYLRSNLSLEKYYIARCEMCQPILPMPFRDSEQRNEWARVHSTVKDVETAELHRVKIYTEWK